MRLWPRPRQLPDRVARALPGQRVLAAAEVVDGRWLVGTRDRLVVLPAVPQEAAEGTVLLWERLRRADWDTDSATLRLEPLADYGQPVTPLVVTLVREPDPALLLDLVRERITASLVVQRRVPVAGKRGLTVVGRRPPGGGEVTWAYELDAGIDPEDPLVMTAAELALRDTRESLGL